MNPRSDLTASNFRTAEEEIQALRTHERYAGPESAYRLAFTDEDFMLRPELRPIRLQLELLKPELVQQEQGVESTIVIFGSARILPPEQAHAALAQAHEDGADPTALRRAETAVAMSRYYDEARRLAHLVTARTRCMTTPIFISTGGGPGIMEAGNRGAFEAGGKSLGLNIVLAHEQHPNPYITPELCFQFHYFAMRKMHFLMRSVALVCFPGGFGTLDELFETLTLMQNGKCRRRPILLFSREFWRRLIDFDYLVEIGMISAEDLHLFRYVESAEEAWHLLATDYGLHAWDRQDGAHSEDM